MDPSLKATSPQYSFIRIVLCKRKVKNRDKKDLRTLPLNFKYFMYLFFFFQHPQSATMDDPPAADPPPDVNFDSEMDTDDEDDDGLVSGFFRYGIKQRKILAAKLSNWHLKLREGLIKSKPIGHRQLHPKWGRFQPSRRYNLDQVPMAFCTTSNDTYDDRVWCGIGQKRHWKRQCTLQVCFSPENNQLKIEVIFRGSGQRIKAQEQAAYHRSVDVYWYVCFVNLICVVRNLELK